MRVVADLSLAGAALRAELIRRGLLRPRLDHRPEVWDPADERALTQPTLRLDGGSRRALARDGVPT